MTALRENTIIPINYIERKPDSSFYRVVGKGVTVEFLVGFIDDPNWTVEQICEGWGLTPAEVHAAWSFYYDHKAEIDENRRRSREFYETLPDIREHLERKRREREAKNSGE
ncbi:MAG: DUF433 domain-containing protein [Anaerolineae bacterium]|nr:DUF433 domain-containing protein [Anaerolineae bacterium]